MKYQYPGKYSVAFLQLLRIFNPDSRIYSGEMYYLMPIKEFPYTDGYKDLIYKIEQIYTSFIVELNHMVDEGIVHKSDRVSFTSYLYTKIKTDSFVIRFLNDSREYKAGIYKRIENAKFLQMTKGNIVIGEKQVEELVNTIYRILDNLEVEFDKMIRMRLFTEKSYSRASKEPQGDFEKHLDTDIDSFYQLLDNLNNEYRKLFGDKDLYDLKFNKESGERSYYWNESLDTCGLFIDYLFRRAYIKDNRPFSKQRKKLSILAVRFFNIKIDKSSKDPYSQFRPSRAKAKDKGIYKRLFDSIAPNINA